VSVSDAGKSASSTRRRLKEEEEEEEMNEVSVLSLALIEGDVNKHKFCERALSRKPHVRLPVHKMHRPTQRPC